MRIKSFKFDDHRADWHLEETTFDAFNLLVGVSGVGKTKILEALRRVCRIATEGEYNPGQIEWAIEFEQGDQAYQWEGRTEAFEGDGFPDNEASSEMLNDAKGATRIFHERLDNETETLINRDEKKFLFKGRELPRLKRAESALSLLEDEKSIVPVRDGFRHILLSKAAVALPYDLSRSATSDRDARVAMYREFSKEPAGFDRFRETLTRAGLSKVSEYAPLAAYYLQEAFTEQFEEFKSTFTDIFVSVDDIRAVVSKGIDSRFIRLELNIREKGSTTWITQSEISSGMLRTLVHLIELTIAPPGSVIIIDEFENSLGVNCMPQLTDFIMSRAPDLQFILTSHHPYIINKIPIDTWKVVTRKGGHVHVKSARGIPALQAASHHDAFIRLINLREFEEGIE